jgi:hypothetical protein
MLLYRFFKILYRHFIYYQLLWIKLYWQQTKIQPGNIICSINNSSEGGVVTDMSAINNVSIKDKSKNIIYYSSGLTTRIFIICT